MTAFRLFGRRSMPLDALALTPFLHADGLVLLFMFMSSLGVLLGILVFF